METRAHSINAGLGVQFTCYLLSPAAIEPVEIEVLDIKRGERTTLLRAVLMQDDRLIAEASAVFTTPRGLSAVPEIPKSAQKRDAEYYDIGDFSDTPWFRDAIEMERDKQGWFWLKHKMPITPHMGPLSFVASLSDWTAGLTRPDWFGTNNVIGFPNADLTIHLVREPESEWLGIDGRSHWLPHGAGLTFANLYDEAGFIGRCSQSVVLIAND
jgi:acyl-CoA thioesterase